MVYTKDYNATKWDDYFYIDETSPSGLRWKVDRRCGKNYLSVKTKAGTVAGSLQWYNSGKSKRWSVEFENKPYKVHRIIFVLIHGSIEIDKVIDHLDGDSSNNKIENLAMKSQKLNTQNSKMKSVNTSGIVGVHFDTKFSKGVTYTYWVARWVSGYKKCFKHFSINKLGYKEALVQATEYRLNQMLLLNEGGSNYTERHIYGNKGG